MTDSISSPVGRDLRGDAIEPVRIKSWTSAAERRTARSAGQGWLGHHAVASNTHNVAFQSMQAPTLGGTRRRSS